MSLNLEQLQKLWHLNRRLDNLIEEYILYDFKLKASLGKLYYFLMKEINISAFIVKTKDENLIDTIFAFGKYTNYDRNIISSFSSNQTQTFSGNDLIWLVQPIDVSGRIIGIVALGFKKDLVIDNEGFYDEILECVSEQLDTYLYRIQSLSEKQNLIINLQNSFSEQEIKYSIEKSVSLLYKKLNFKHLLIAYSDQDDISNQNIKYYLFEDGISIYDYKEKPSDLLNNIIKNRENNFLEISKKELIDKLGINNADVLYLTRNSYDSTVIGFICIEIQKENKDKTLDKEIIKIFSEEFRKKLNRHILEKDILRSNFNEDIVSKLVKIPNYQQNYIIVPHKKEIGVIFADICGFTKISEQILKKPEKITSFVDKWSEGVVSRMYSLEATLDKIIGDCVMFLFGPPFYDISQEQIVDNMLKGAVAIIEYTKEYLNSDENIEIKNHPDFRKFGVTIGINLCDSIVGQIGPNKNFTAFSSGINIASRIQHLAENNEIIVTEHVKEIATKSSTKWKFSPKKQALVKNIEEPLPYYSLIIDK